jgi:hypothetical protein
MRKMESPDQWQVDVAAMLLPLAQISLPPETAARISRGADLTMEERSMIAKLPEVADRLLAHIPRLETVRAILASVHGVPRQPGCEVSATEETLVPKGAGLIKVAVAYDALTQKGMSSDNAIGAMRSKAGAFDAGVLALLGELYAKSAELAEIVSISVNGLATGMVLAEDLVTRGGLLVVTQGTELTETFVERIRNYRPGTFNASVRVALSPATAKG